MRPVLRLSLAATALVLVLCGCQRAAEAPAATAATAPAPMPRPQASLIDLMSGLIAPTADALWGAVGTTNGPKGPEDKKPTTDADWAELRREALLMAEAGNLLAVPDRPQLLPGQKLANPPGEGDLTPEQSAQKIKADWNAWLVFAQGLQNSAMATLKAIDARDVDAFVEAGGAIDEACEQCHKQFWYPNAPTPP